MRYEENSCSSAGSPSCRLPAARKRDEGGAGYGNQDHGTIFPEYDWVREILGGNPAGMKLSLLLDSGADLHNFQPTADDMVAISSSDVFIFVGGESDKWVDDILKRVGSGKMKTISLLDILGDRAMEEEHDHDGYDEHVWLSLRNASVFCTEIARVLSELDPQNAQLYARNLDSYLKKLSALDAEYSRTVENARFKAMVFGDRFPFAYLAADYGLECHAAFSGCSAETEASFETIASLSSKLDELGLGCVMAIDGSDGKIARTIIRNSGSQDRRVLVLDSMQSVTSADVKAGSTYLGIMEKNLGVLSEALN
ncbi:MAG: zinc ABC transporter substrate-binding protein [Spirochaetales bacterium]|nr:zinc ABC transporter substrate-binding protein [Spirochaetales bacterium]